MDNIEFQKIIGEISPVDLTESRIQQLIEKYPAHKDELLSLMTTWEDLQHIEAPAPSAEMDSNFYRMLNEVERPVVHMQPQKEKTLFKGFYQLFTVQNMAIAAVFMTGILLGRYTMQSSATSQPDSFNSGQVTNLVSNRIVSEKSSAFERMESIQMTRDLTNPDDMIIEALNKAMINDENINVRLSAIQTLTLFADQPKVRSYLIMAIPYQTSPIVQLELAELMLKLEENQSATQWKELLESENMEADVRIELKEKLAKLL